MFVAVDSAYDPNTYDPWTPKRTPKPLPDWGFYVLMDYATELLPDSEQFETGLPVLSWHNHTLMADLARAPTGTVLRHGGADWQEWDFEVPAFWGFGGFVTVTVLEGDPVPVPLPAAGGVFAVALGLVDLWRRKGRSD